MTTRSRRSRSRTRLFERCLALLLPSVAAAQSDRPAATEVFITALRAAQIDSVCRRCHVVVVDTVIEGGAAPAVDWAYPSAIQALSTPTHRYIVGTHPHGYQPRDTAFVTTIFSPAALTIADSGQVFVDFDVPDSYGWEVIVQVQRREGKWTVLAVWYHEG